MIQGLSVTMRFTRHNFLFLISPAYRRVRRRLSSIEASLACH